MASISQSVAQFNPTRRFYGHTTRFFPGPDASHARWRDSN